MRILDYISEQTVKYLEEIPKGERKKKGQFFTPKKTAEFMASLFDFSNSNKTITLLDPGCGTGILTAAFLERVQEYSNIESVYLTCYETDKEILPLLKNNLKYIENNVNIYFEYEIVEADYLITQANAFNSVPALLTPEKKYDFVIGNPPYLRIPRTHEAAQQMSSVVHGAPNLYFLFASMSMFNLENYGQMVYIIPRSWTSGAYFAAFRKYIFNYGKIDHIHLFVKRDKVFSDEQVLQETMIIKMSKKTEPNHFVTLTSSQSSDDFHAISSLCLPYDSVVAGKDLYVYLPTSVNDIEVVRTVNKYNQTLPDIELRMRTGIVVDFREYSSLREEESLDTVPLFYAQHIRNGRVNHSPSGKVFDWIITEKQGLIQENKNYVFCKRFTAKEEKRRLQCGIYLSSDFPEYKYIGTQNKINFIDDVHKKQLSQNEVYGIYALLNSTLFDNYYRILNGSTQVNSTEVNSIPVPPREIIKKIGEALINAGDLSTETCDKLIKEIAYG